MSKRVAFLVTAALKKANYCNHIMNCQITDLKSLLFPQTKRQSSGLEGSHWDAEFKVDMKLENVSPDFDTLCSPGESSILTT